MRLNKATGNIAGAVMLGFIIASCATDDSRGVQVRDGETTGPAQVSPEGQLEQQRQLEERQRDQRQQDRRQQDLERARQDTQPTINSVHASSITKVPVVVDATPLPPQGRDTSVNGELLRMEGEYFVIRDASGREVRLQVTNETKMENAVQVGDKIEAQVSGGNHADTVRRVDKSRAD
jgi:hypothetical protein